MILCRESHVHTPILHEDYIDIDIAFDHLKLNIFINIAELKSDKICVQDRNILKEKIPKDKLIKTHAPFGYPFRSGQFTINPDEAPTVKVVFNYYLLSSGYIKPSQYIEEDKLLIKRKTYQVRNIIINPNYCGLATNQYGQSNNMFPPILSTAIYERVQTIRTQKQVIRIESVNQLKRKIKCFCCHSTLTNMTIIRKNQVLTQTIPTSRIVK